MTESPPVSVHILTHNRPEDLHDCLEAVSRMDYPKTQLEVLVFDDASSPGNAEKNRQEIAAAQASGFRKAEVVYSDENVNHLEGRCRLAAVSSEDCRHFLQLDDDGRVEADTLVQLLHSLSGESRLGAVGPRIVADSNPERVLHPPAFVSPWTGFYRMTETDQPIEPDWINSTCWLLRRDAFEDVGGTEGGFFQSHGEADFCLRLKKAGWKIRYDPRTRARHVIEPGTVRRRRLYHLYRNKFWVIRRNFPLLRRSTALFCHAVLGTPRHLSESLQNGLNGEEIRLILKSTWDGLFGRLP